MKNSIKNAESVFENEISLRNDPYIYKMYQVIKHCSNEEDVLKILAEGYILVSKELKRVTNELIEEKRMSVRPILKELEHGRA